MMLPEGVVIEILLRLPLKYLCRCKCVSKTWWSIISDIKQVHHARKLGIVISNCGSLFLSRLCLDNNNNSTLPPPPLLDLEGGEEIGFTQVINGLFCVYTPPPSGSLTLCNCYTSETKNIPLPEFFRRTHKVEFFLGFVPFDGTYKLLSLGLLRNHDLVLYREILTLGGVKNKHNLTVGSWIKRWPADYLPDIDVMCKPSISIGGILYWLVECKTPRILAFNLHAGSFYDMFLPAHLDDLSTAKIVNFKGGLAVGCLGTSSSKLRILNLWKLNNYPRCWIKHSITLPEELIRCNNRNSWCSFGNLPTGEILVANPKANGDDSDFIPIYSYDHSTVKFQRFVVGKFPPFMGEKSSFQISCVELISSSHSLEALLCEQPISTLPLRSQKLPIFEFLRRGQKLPISMHRRRSEYLYTSSSIWGAELEEYEYDEQGRLNKIEDLKRPKSFLLK